MLRNGHRHATAEQQEILDAIAAASVELRVLLPWAADLVRSGAVTDDADGGQSGSEVTVPTGVPCRVRALTGYDAVSAATVAPNATYRVTVDMGTDVRTTDALLVDGIRYEVVYVSHSTYQAQIGCLCSVAG